MKEYGTFCRLCVKSDQSVGQLGQTLNGQIIQNRTKTKLILKKKEWEQKRKDGKERKQASPTSRQTTEIGNVCEGDISDKFFFVISFFSCQFVCKCKQWKARKVASVHFQDVLEWTRSDRILNWQVTRVDEKQQVKGKQRLTDHKVTENSNKQNDGQNEPWVLWLIIANQIIITEIQLYICDLYLYELLVRQTFCKTTEPEHS